MLSRKRLSSCTTTLTSDVAPDDGKASLATTARRRASARRREIRGCSGSSVARQHRANFDLWHIEDEARIPGAPTPSLPR